MTGKPDATNLLFGGLPMLFSMAFHGFPTLWRFSDKPIHFWKEDNDTIESQGGKYREVSLYPAVDKRWDTPCILVYACGPKTVLVKRTFLNIAIVGWGGVGWGRVGWGGVGGHVNVPCTSYMIYCHAAKISGIVYYVTCCYAAEISSVGWGGVGWGGMLTFLVLRAKSALLMVYARAWQWRCIHKNADCQLFTTHALQRWRWKTKKRAPSFSRISNHQISTALW